MKSDDLIIKAKKVKGEDGYRVFSIRIREELVCRIDDIVEKSGHSRNELIGIFIEYALERCKIEDAE